MARFFVLDLSIFPEIYRGVPHLESFKSCLSRLVAPNLPTEDTRHSTHEKAGPRLGLQLGELQI